MTGKKCASEWGVQVIRWKIQVDEGIDGARVLTMWMVETSRAGESTSAAESEAEEW